MKSFTGKTGRKKTDRVHECLVVLARPAGVPQAVADLLRPAGRSSPGPHGLPGHT